MATYPNHKKQNRGGFHGGFHGSNPTAQYSHGNLAQGRGYTNTASFQNNRGGGHPGRGSGGRGHNRGGRSSWTSNRPQCQLCGKLGHVVAQCWHRFDESFTSYSSQQHMSQMSAMIATPYTTSDPLWYPDSGATNHLTPDVNNLIHKIKYTGLDQIHMGNGECVFIKHIGHSYFASDYQPRILTLKKLLHVPSITKNLLSISKFAADNHVYFEFHSSCCIVKDQSSHSHGREA